MNRFTTPTAFILMTLVTAASAALEGCVQLDYQCTECFMRHLYSDGSCSYQLPATDPCNICANKAASGKKYDSCILCKPGYASNQGFSCVKGTISGCLAEFANTDSSRASNSCFGCEPGKYSVIDPQTNTTSCKAVANPAPNCLWGGTSNHGYYRGNACFRCKPGFAVSVFSGQCLPAVQKGCWTQKGGICVTCDPFAGYSISTFGNCFLTL